MSRATILLLRLIHLALFLLRTMKEEEVMGGRDRSVVDRIDIHIIIIMALIQTTRHVMGVEMGREQEMEICQKGLFDEAKQHQKGRPLGEERRAQTRMRRYLRM